MSKRKKKNAVTLILLLFALVGLIGLYFWYSKQQPTSEEEAKEEELILSTIDTEKISALHYIYKDTDLKLIKDGEVWVAEKDKSRPINQDRVKSILGVIDEISATRVIAETTEARADYGLADPISYLQATLKDGSEVTLQIGNEAVTGDGYYALVNDKDNIYLLENTYGNGLMFMDEDLTAVAGDLTLEAANIRHISVENRDTQDFELLYQESNTLDNSGSAMYPWVILKPYTQGYSADSQVVTTFLQKYSTFDYIKCVDYNPSGLGKYGLDNPMSVIRLNYLEARTEKLDKPEKNPDTGKEITEKTYYDPKEYQLKVGNLDENDNYYVMIMGDKAVYTIDKDAIDNMIQVDVFSLMSKFVAIPNIDMVENIDITIDGKAYTMHIDRTASKNDKGEAEVATTYFYNGKEVEEKLFKEVYQRIITAKYDALIKEDINRGDIAPYLTTTFYLNDEKKTVLTASYLPYNESFYLIKNGETRFFADKRKVDDIVKAIIDFKAAKE